MRRLHIDATIVVIVIVDVRLVIAVRTAFPAHPRKLSAKHKFKPSAVVTSHSLNSQPWVGIVDRAHSKGTKKTLLLR
jgi:hypothetical protein